MKKPLVTVVTLTYKKFEYIYNTIDSVINQTYPRIEYIISDDGSTNFPKTEIEDYLEKNRRDNILNYEIFSSEKNLGTVRNINYAYQNSSGEILIPLSADDIFYEYDVIEKIVKCFMEKKCNVLVTSRMICDERGGEIKKTPSQKEQHFIQRFDSAWKQHVAFITDEFYNMASGSAMYLKRSFLEQWGFFDESYILWEDGPFLTQYTRENKIEINYSIISIKYRLGGISNGISNPLMYKDRIHYNRVERLFDSANLSWLQKRKVEYICKRYECISKISILLTYVCYLDVMLCKLLYKFKL